MTVNNSQAPAAWNPRWRRVNHSQAKDPRRLPRSLDAGDQVPHVAMLDCDVASGLPAIPEVDARQARWTAALVLVRVFTEPIGILELPVPTGGMSGEDLAGAVGLEFGQVVRDRINGCGLPWEGRVPTSGLRPAHTPAFLESRARVLRDAPAITVAICTRNRPEWLARALASLQGQEYPEWRVLVVDSGPVDDRTRVVTEEFADRLALSYVAVSRPGLSRAKNRAIEVCETEVIAWMDDDEECDRWWLAELARGFAEHPEAGAVSGIIVPAEIETLPQRWFEQYGGHRKGRGFASAVFSPATRHLQSPLYPLPPFGTGGNLAIRRAAFELVGRFDCAPGAGTPAMGAEDTAALTTLLYLGGTAVYQPTAVIRHWHRSDLDTLRNMFLGYGRGLGAFYASMVIRHPGSIPELLRLSHKAVRDMTSRHGLRLGGLEEDFPEEFLRIHRAGLLQGPAMYAWGRLASWRLRRAGLSA